MKIFKTFTLLTFTLAFLQFAPSTSAASSCRVTSECNQGYQCIGGACSPIPDPNSCGTQDYCVLNSNPGTFWATCCAPGYKCQNNTCVRPTPPPTSTPTPTPSPTASPSSTPTPSPSSSVYPSPSASFSSSPSPSPSYIPFAACYQVAMFNTQGAPLTKLQLSTKQAGDQILMCAQGTSATGSFTQVQFTVNNVKRPISTMIKPSDPSDDPSSHPFLCDLYTIPQNTYDFKMSAIIYHTQAGW